MWRSYFQVFFRNLAQQKTLAAINVLGLALGLCAVLTIGVYVQSEYSHEAHWRNADRIARLVTHVTLPGGDRIRFANSSELAGPRFKEYFPDEIELSARITTAVSGTVSVDGEEFNGWINQADRELIDVFDFEVVEGSLEQVFAGPYRLAVSEEEARRLPGGGSALGKLLTLEVPDKGAVTYEVVAVYRAPPGRGSLHYIDENFTMWSETAMETAARQDWFMTAATHNYFLLREGVDPAALAPRMDAFVDQYVTVGFQPPEGGTTSDVFTYRLQNIRDIYFNPNSDESGGSQSTVNAFGAIALLVLGIGWSNFVILSLARSTERQREVGIRKTAGATGPYLLSQFVSEALLLAFIALVIALVLLEAALPVFAALMQTELSIDWTASTTLLSLAALLFVTGCIGGLYPAVVLARQKPELVLKPGGHSGALGSGLLRKTLVSLQFLIATALIIATLVMYLQMAFLRERDPGFDTANVVTLALQDVENPSEVAVLRNAVAAIPGVERNALASREAANDTDLLIRMLRRSGEESPIEVRNFLIDYDFFAIYGMELLAGGGYDRALEATGQAALATQSRPRVQMLRDRIVLSETAVRALGFSSPAEAVGAVIEQQLNGPEGELYVPVEIIGVVADNQFRSLRVAPGNEAYSLNSFASWYLTLKIDPAAISLITAELQRVWRELRPLREPEITFADVRVQQAFALEQNSGRLLSGFALLAIVVACMGLYGLVAFETRRRTKEISIRGVLGAELTNILKLFLARFAGPVLWTNALAWPLALWFMLRWLEQFPYRIDNGWLLPVCVIAAALVVGIVALTVGATVVRLVESRPAQALRCE